MQPVHHPVQRLIGEQPPRRGAPTVSTVLEVTDWRAGSSSCRGSAAVVRDGLGEGRRGRASRPAGVAFLLDGLRRLLGIDSLILGAGQKARGGRAGTLTANERIVFGLVAKALAPASKLAAADWMNHDVEIPRRATVPDRHRQLDAGG